MNKRFTAFCFLLAILTLSSMHPFKPTRVVFFGDSITQAGVNAGGYITLMQQMLKQKNQAENYEFVGAGIGGNKIYDLYLRLENDVLSKKPDMVVVFVGVNDVWHKRTSGTGTDADKFEKFYTALIEKLKANNIKVLLCTPAAIGEKTDFSNELDGDLNKYANIIRNLAAKNNVPVCDLRKAFLQHNQQKNSENKDKGILTTDGVHLNAAGNQLVADMFYNMIVK